VNKKKLFLVLALRCAFYVAPLSKCAFAIFIVSSTKGKTGKTGGTNWQGSGDVDGFRLLRLLFFLLQRKKKHIDKVMIILTLKINQKGKKERKKGRKYTVL